MSEEPAELDECPHGMGDPEWCVLCNGRARREAKQWAAIVEEQRRVARFMAARRHAEAQRGRIEDAKRNRSWISGNTVPGKDTSLIDEFGKGHTTKRRP